MQRFARLRHPTSPTLAFAALGVALSACSVDAALPGREPCADPGALRCGHAGLETCIDDGGDVHWGEPVNCPYGAACVDGTCEPGAGGKEDSASALDVDGDGVLRIDAAFDKGDKAYFFMADQYIRYDLVADRADPGYPRPIAGNWIGVRWRDLDATARTSARDVYFFKGSEVLRYDLERDTVAQAPRPIADVFPGLWDRGIDAALSPGDGKLYVFKGSEYMRFDLTKRAVDDGFPRSIEEGWPGLWASDIDAALWTKAGKIYFFSWDEYLRYDWAKDVADDGYPLGRTFRWPGLWDLDEGTGRPGARMPDDVRAALDLRPADDEHAARRARVAASAVGYDDLTSRFPEYVRSIEERLHAWGCGLLRSKTSSSTHRFRCATDTRGALPLDIAPLGVESIDWANAAFHVDQRSQGDFMASQGTPLSVFGVDDGVFYIHAITGNARTGSISSGLNIKVRFKIDGAEKIWGFSHLDTQVPRYVIDALRDGTPLTEGTVFGFIGYTGNLWIGPPPTTDGPYVGNGRGLPQAHTHIWFATGRLADDPECHLKLPAWARRVLDFSGTYPNGGG